MTSHLAIFDFQEQPVRILDRDNQPWFVAADVCRVLGLEQVTNAIRDLEEDEKITLTNDKGNPRAGIPHQMNLISESGLYALIFKSRKEEARAFRKWVTSEVLPALRTTGRYEAPRAEERPAPQLPLGFTIPMFLQMEHSDHETLSFRDRLRFGRLCKQLGNAMGVRPTMEVDPSYGKMPSWPVALCREAMDEVMRDKSSKRPELAEIQTLLQTAASLFTAQHEFRLHDLLAMASHHGLRISGELVRPGKPELGALKVLGRRLQKSLGQPLRMPSGATFRLRKRRYRTGARYFLDFSQF